MLMTIVWAVLGLALGLVVLLALAFGVLTLVGRGVPEEHEAASVIDLRCPPEKAFALIDDVERQAEWDPRVTGVERLPDQHGLPAVRMRMGRNAFVPVTTRREPPRLIERTITDEHGPFSGTWLYTVEPTPAGCAVRLRELGRVRIAFARAVMTHFTGYHVYVNKHLAAIGERLGASGGPRKA